MRVCGTCSRAGGDGSLGHFFLSDDGGSSWMRFTGGVESLVYVALFARLVRSNLTNTW